MLKKSGVLSLLPFFLLSAIYLCPCKVTFASSLAETLPHCERLDKGDKSHNCCDRMANCPKKETSGIKNLLSTFAAFPSQDHISDLNAFAQPIVYEINQTLTDTPQFDPLDL